MAKAPRVASLKEQELNRWCVEMAMKWPVVTTYGGSGGGLPSQQSDADVIGRAAKIREWVKGS